VHADVWETYADWQLAMGQTEAAGESYARALDLAPDNLSILAKLESHWRRRGDAARAEVYRARRVELVPLQAAEPAQPGGAPAPR
jgi:Tfp pilus assembly protein PilF